MKILVKLITVYFFIAGTATNSYAQQNRDVLENIKDTVVVYSRPHVFKINLLGPLSPIYEIQVQPKRSLQLSMGRLEFEGFGSTTRYFNLTVGYKYYLSAKASTVQRPYPAGFYISPYLRYKNVRNYGEGFFSSTNTKMFDIAYNMFGAGATIGYQVIYQKGFTLDFFGGGGYLPLHSSNIKYLYDRNDKSYITPEDYVLDLRVGLCLGFAY